MKTEAFQYVDRYAQVEVKFIPGHNPDLVLYDAAGAEIERIDLTKDAPSIAQLEGLLADKGFTKSAAPADAPDCADASSDCMEWAKAGECKNNAPYMEVSCKRSCGLCPVDAPKEEL